MTANSFTLNGVRYSAKPFSYGMVVELEKRGVPISEAEKMPHSLISAYFAICADISNEQAEKLIENHIINGGDLEDIAEPMAKEMNESDFFRALSEKKEQTSTPSKGEKKKQIEQ